MICFQLCSDLIKEWIKENPQASICTAEGIDSFSDIAVFQDYHGLKQFRQVFISFLIRFFYYYTVSIKLLYTYICYSIKYFYAHSRTLVW